MQNVFHQYTISTHSHELKEGFSHVSGKGNLIRVIHYHTSTIGFNIFNNTVHINYIGTMGPEKTIGFIQGVFKLFYFSADKNILTIIHDEVGIAAICFKVNNVVKGNKEYAS